MEKIIIRLAIVLSILGAIAFVLKGREKVNKLKKSATTVSQCSVMLVYALSLAFMRTEIRIIEPPERIFLTSLCFAIPLMVILAIFKEWRKVKGWGLILMGAMWFIIAYLYMTAPIYNAGWIISAGQGTITWVSLARGDYSGK